MTKSPCLEAGCPRFAHYRGRCPEHARQNEGQIQRAGREGSQLYGLKKWRMLRRQVLYEQPLCACGCGEIAEEVDHIVPLAEGMDPYDRANLQGLTKRCHSEKTAREVNARIAIRG